MMVQKILCFYSSEILLSAVPDCSSGPSLSFGADQRTFLRAKAHFPCRASRKFLPRCPSRSHLRFRLRRPGDPSASQPNFRSLRLRRQNIPHRHRRILPNPRHLSTLRLHPDHRIRFHETGSLRKLIFFPSAAERFRIPDR